MPPDGTGESWPTQSVPTTTQTLGSGHATPKASSLVTATGTSCQVAPPSRLARSWPPAGTNPVMAVDGVPTATQIPVAQVTSRRIPTPVGNALPVHNAPPSRLSAIAPAPCPGLVGTAPVARQTEALGQVTPAGDIPEGRAPPRIQVAPWSLLTALHDVLPSVAQGDALPLAGAVHGDHGGSTSRALSEHPVPAAVIGGDDRARAPATPTATQSPSADAAHRGEHGHRARHRLRRPVRPAVVGGVDGRRHPGAQPDGPAVVGVPACDGGDAGHGSGSGLADGDDRGRVAVVPRRRARPALWAWPATVPKGEEHRQAADPHPWAGRPVSHRSLHEADPPWSGRNSTLRECWVPCGSVRALVGYPRRAVDWVDLVLLVAVVAAGVQGLRLGALVQVFTFGGFWLGLILGTLLSIALVSSLRPGPVEVGGDPRCGPRLGHPARRRRPHRRGVEQRRRCAATISGGSTRAWAWRSRWWRCSYRPGCSAASCPNPGTPGSGTPSPVPMCCGRSTR